MITNFLKFFIGLAVLICIVLPVNYFVMEELLDTPFTALNYFVYIYFIILVTAIQFYMTSSLNKRPQRFVISFMASMGVKIFLSLILLVIIMYSGMNNSKSFAINFMVVYLVFSFFSISHILRVQKSRSETREKSI